MRLGTSWQKIWASMTLLHDHTVFPCPSLLSCQKADIEQECPECPELLDQNDTKPTTHKNTIKLLRWHEGIAQWMFTVIQYSFYQYEQKTLNSSGLSHWVDWNRWWMVIDENHWKSMIRFEARTSPKTGAWCQAHAGSWASQCPQSKPPIQVWQSDVEVIEVNSVTTLQR
jgi:hypothetical protein